MKNKIVSQIGTMFTASIALVAALAWNEAVQSVFRKVYYFQEKRIIAQFIYALVITVIAVVISTVFAKFLKDE